MRQQSGSPQQQQQHPPQSQPQPQPQPQLVQPLAAPPQLQPAGPSGLLVAPAPAPAPAAAAASAVSELAAAVTAAISAAAVPIVRALQPQPQRVWGGRQPWVVGPGQLVPTPLQFVSSYAQPYGSAYAQQPPQLAPATWALLPPGGGDGPSFSL